MKIFKAKLPNEITFMVSHFGLNPIEVEISVNTVIKKYTG